MAAHPLVLQLHGSSAFQPARLDSPIYLFIPLEGGSGISAYLGPKGSMFFSPSGGALMSATVLRGGPYFLPVNLLGGSSIFVQAIRRAHALSVGITGSGLFSASGLGREVADLNASLSGGSNFVLAALKSTHPLALSLTGSGALDAPLFDAYPVIALAQVGEIQGTFNLFPNPSFEYTGTQARAGWYTNAPMGLVEASDHAWDGNVSAYTEIQNGVTTHVSFSVEGLDYQPSALQAYFFMRPSHVNFTAYVWMYLEYRDGTDTYVETVLDPLLFVEDEWNQVFVDVVEPVKPVVYMDTGIAVTPVGVLPVWFDGVQIEPHLGDPYTPFAYGDYPGHYWTGVPGRSFSVRPTSRGT